ncbi:MAG: zinc ribbon domain-containing protein [Verrucomicrobia bacterium]|nr:zinc ribbon domain-containing protein [Verrucomicrobiota bacterium]
MPTYEYRCQKCHKTFEAVQSMKDPRFTICPEALCQQEGGGWGQGEVTRLLGTGAGLIFKGSGFYITDYRSESYKQGAKQESGSTATGGGEKKSGGGEGGGKETKSAPAASGGSGAASGGGASPAPSSSSAAPPPSSSPSKPAT